VFYFLEQPRKGKGVIVEEAIKKIGFMGLGAMGNPMSQRLLDAGYSLLVFDKRKEGMDPLLRAGAQEAQSPMEMAKKAQLIITMLPDSPAVEEVVLGSEGILRSFSPGSILMDMSTSSPYSTQMIAKALAEKGIEMLDAPVSGGVWGAKAGELTIMVGGRQEILGKVRPTLAVLGKKIFYLGNHGNGNIAKLVNNLLAASLQSASSEAFMLGLKAGLPLDVLLEVLRSGSGRNYSVEVKIPKFVLPGQFDPGFAIDLMSKDLDLAMEVARQTKVPVPCGALAQQIYRMAKAEGLGQKDSCAVIKIWEKWTHMEARSKPEQR
jgi:2-hydroxymethylglutarate dehydrogenase